MIYLFTMKQLLCIFFGLVMIVPFAWSSNNVTPSEQCPGQSFDDLRERIQVIPCGKNRCKLQKGNNTTVIFKFKPEMEVKSLVSDVYADINGLKLPFIGVTGVSACEHVKKADTGELAPCPLAAGQEYIYTNVFYIEPIYPSATLRVHWSLLDGDKNVICFEVPAIITGQSKRN